MEHKDKLNQFELKINKARKIDFFDIFQNSNPVHIEIGCGNGHFLKEKSLELPRINFLGFEIKYKRIEKLLKKINYKENCNVRICRFYIDKDITSILSKNSIAAVYINFPDPWPKRRHHKYRLIQDEFLNSLNYLLNKDGKVMIATDHVGYRDWIINKISQRNDFESLYSKGFREDPYDGYFTTVFEDLQKSKGFKPFFMSYRKL